MLRIYRTEDNGKLTKLKKNKILPMTWCSLVNPNEEELLQVSTNLHIDYDLLNTHVSNMQAYLNENKVELENKNITYEEMMFTKYIKTYSLL